MAGQYLITIAVGPVQEFIASARKLRDLWYGSFLLSELSKAAALSLHEQSCDLIFPAVADPADLQPDTAMNVANKILALSPVDAEPSELVESAERGYRQRWDDICHAAENKAGRGAVNQDMFLCQVNDFGEFFGAWVPFDAQKHTDRYPVVLERCEQLLAGRKSLREFSAPTWDGTGKPKSSLDGIRESVIQRVPSANRAFQIREGEELDALGVVKRFGPWNHSNRPQFENLAQVAALPYLKGVEQSVDEDRSLAELLQELPDAETLYPEEKSRPPAVQAGSPIWPQDRGLSIELLHPSVLEAELSGTTAAGNPAPWKELSASLRRLWKKTTEPSPYVCLLVGDGDNMGKTLALLHDPAAHQQFSRELDQFARDVHELVEKKSGKVVYSGGDDVMAYVPLHTFLDCAVAINTLFKETMDRACTGVAGGVEIPTFSIGAAIVHMRMPMNKALDLARQAERIAKDEGKKCLAIIQSKRGGSDLTIRGSWDSNDLLPSLPARLSAFAEAFSRDLLSSRLAYQLRPIVRDCGPALGWNEVDGVLQPATAATAEALHLICRKRKNDQQITREEAEMLLAGQSMIRDLADELVIARQLSQAMDLSNAAWRKGGKKS